MDHGWISVKVHPNAGKDVLVGVGPGRFEAWVKAKPEWAKGSQLIRITPRFNPEVNGYWMCDQGRKTYQHQNLEKVRNFG